MTAALTLRRLRNDLAGPFDLELGAGTCAAITGPSGSGKSLFLRMIADLDPNEGEVWLGGAERASFGPTQWRGRVTYVSAESGWWAERVIDHFPGHHRDEVAELAARIGIAAELLDAPVVHLSTGERQRMALARAFLARPPILLLDEPTGPLDEQSTAAVETLLRALMADATSILLVTHDSNQAQRLGARHYRMASGRLEAA